ncbi:hypothetical protein [Halpernia frigidisoli]|uniref:hypothetical protein n=1 Tax=Halpernia frigidisoli TaxID=1125876 RepID=UPI0015A5BA03|nr:hypothetical protein [Halpernia frigidisoli]
MFKPLFFRLFFVSICISIFGKAQVDVVYQDLVFSDEFNVNGAVDNGKRFHQT